MPRKPHGYQIGSRFGELIRKLLEQSALGKVHFKYGMDGAHGVILIGDDRHGEGDRILGLGTFAVAEQEVSISSSLRPNVPAGVPEVYTSSARLEGGTLLLPQF